MKLPFNLCDCRTWSDNGCRCKCTVPLLCTRYVIETLCALCVPVSTCVSVHRLCLHTETSDDSVEVFTPSDDITHSVTSNGKGRWPHTVE